jgi:hypothetical protein
LKFFETGENVESGCKKDAFEVFRVLKSIKFVSNGDTQSGIELEKLQTFI